MTTWTTTGGDQVQVYPAPYTCSRTDCLVNHREFRYRVVSGNGEIVEIGSEGYTRKAAAITAALRHHPRVEVE